MTENDNYIPLNNKKYVKYSEAKAGDILVEDAVFIGTETNQYARLNFLFEKDGAIYALPECGALKFNNNQNKIKTGHMFKIIYDGTAIMDKGAMRGKEYHKLKIYSKSPNGQVETPDSVPF